MAGHSKWSKVKHQKKLTDAAKGKLFAKLTTAINVAIKQGGGITDPESNFHLRLAIERAKSFNMPKNNINRAIDRAVKTDAGQGIDEIVYEAFGPEGIGIIIEAITDNKQRTISKIKQILDRGGGQLADNGSVIHLFNLVGMITIKKNSMSEDELMEIAIDCGADDFEEMGDSVVVYTKQKKLHEVKKNLSSKNINIISSELLYRPKILVDIHDQTQAKKVLKLIDMLEESEDVQKVHANFDIPEEYLSA